MIENHREYETVFILDPTLDEAQEKEQVDRVVQWVEDLGGTMDNVERWGRRRLAYEIHKKRDGIYNILHYHASGDHVKELERRMRINESIMRVLTVVIDPRLKKKMEEAQAAEEAARAAAEAAAAATAAPAEAGGGTGAEAAPSEGEKPGADDNKKPAEATAPTSGEASA